MTTRRPLSIAALMLGLVVAAGCSTPSMRTALHQYYAGRPDLAEQQLQKIRVAEKDRVLFLMERGMVRQALGQYKESAQDFILAASILEELETYSVSRGGASLVINDTVQDFLGAPYERALLHAYTAHNHMAMGHWNDAAVEARRLISLLDPQSRGDYPDDAYCRYVAGFYLSTADDSANTELQYRQAAEQVTGFVLDPATGRLGPPPGIGASSAADQATGPEEIRAHEFVCFVAMGRSPGRHGVSSGSADDPVAAGYAEFYHRDRYLGRSYAFSDTASLAAATEQVEAAWRAAKTASRVVIKDGIADAVGESTDEAWGALAHLVLIGLLERPDLRRWKTLPRSLQVARFPCPEGLDEYQVRFIGADGSPTGSRHILNPIQRYRDLYVSFCSDVPCLTMKGTPILPGVAGHDAERHGTLPPPDVAGP